MSGATSDAHPRPRRPLGHAPDLYARHATVLPVADRGATIRFAPETMPWGMREFEVEDPDGHRLVLDRGVDR